MNALAKNIDGKYELLFSEIDGTFPNHHPDPSDPKNLVFCKNKLLDLKYNVGFAFDGDGDRLGVIDDLEELFLEINYYFFWQKKC